MKVKYIGSEGVVCIDFIMYKICKKGESLVPNKIYEIPDENETLCKAMELSGDFEIVSVPKVAVSVSPVDIMADENVEEKEEV